MSQSSEAKLLDVLVGKRPDPVKKPVVIFLRVTKDNKAWVEAEAKKRHMPVNEFMHDLITALRSAK